MLYSYSKLRTFEKCPLQFRYRYLDRIPATSESIEAFTGKRVHEVLEALYRALAADPKPPALAALSRLHAAAWRRAWHPELMVVKTDYVPLDYYRLGERCLATFYRGNWPFSADSTLALEEEIEFPLGGPDGPRLRGVIDRVAAGAAGTLFIHDYKTATYLPRKDEILGDLQLAIYQLGAGARWPAAGEVKLVWHFLAFGRRVTVGLGRSGLEDKRAQIGRQIERIEAAVRAGDLAARVSPLCRWCAYRTICPAQPETPPPAPLPALESWLEPAAAGEEDGGPLELPPPKEGRGGAAAQAPANQLDLL